MAFMLFEETQELRSNARGEKVTALEATLGLERLIPSFRFY